jgi:ubiquinone/menaquinone biosynthesis C-methylase UbiE
MVDYCLDGEERFGLISSFAYSLGVKLKSGQEFYSFVVDDIKKSGFREILDVGTGPGDVPILLAKSGKFKLVYAVDPSGDMLRIAKAHSKRLKIKFGYGSSRHIPFNKKFDLIISTISFHHWKMKTESLKYLSGFLKKGGEIRIYEFEKRELKGIWRYFMSSHAVSREEMREVAKESGLKLKGFASKGRRLRATLSN